MRGKAAIQRLHVYYYFVNVRIKYSMPKGQIVDTADAITFHSVFAARLRIMYSEDFQTHFTDTVNPWTLGGRSRGQIHRLCRMSGHPNTWISIWSRSTAWAHSMASESADSVLSPGASSFVIAGKTWRIGDAIHSTGVGAVKKKENGSNFWSCVRHCKSRRSLHGPLGQGINIVWNGPIFQNNWFLSTELIIESFRICPQNGLKIHGPQHLSQDPAQSSVAGPNTADVLELHPSSGKDSEPDDAVLQIPAISSLQIWDTGLSKDPSFVCSRSDFFTYCFYSIFLLY